MDELLMVLADPIRREIIDLLAEREHSAGELGAVFPVSQPAISRHLRVLREAGLVHVRGEGQRRIYRLDPAPLAALDDWLAGALPTLLVGAARRAGNPARGTTAGSRRAQPFEKR